MTSHRIFHIVQKANEVIVRQIMYGRKYLPSGGGGGGSSAGASASAGTIGRALVRVEVQLVERKVLQVSNIQN